MRKQCCRENRLVVDEPSEESCEAESSEKESWQLRNEGEDDAFKAAHAIS